MKKVCFGLIGLLLLGGGMAAGARAQKRPLLPETGTVEAVK